MAVAFQVILTGSQEVPPNASQASGFGAVIFDNAAVTASYTFRIQGVDYSFAIGSRLPQTQSTDDDVISTHFHNQAPGVNGPVVFGQINPAQDNDDLAIVLNPDGSWTVSGIWETTDPANVSIANFSTVLGSAEVGTVVPLYFNIHTNQFPGGEIRGQLVAIADDNDNVIQGTSGPDLLPGLGGDDEIHGLAGDDTLDGGDGDDFVDGDQGNDLALLGAGDDVFQWDPGDGSDVVEGQDGFDTLLFNGAGASENITISANGERALFFRDLGNINMDLNDVEKITFNALGGTDTVSINDLSGTDVTEVAINLAGTIGGTTGDGEVDTIIINAPNNNAIVFLSEDEEIVIEGLAARVTISNFDPNDQLIINRLVLSADDVVAAGAMGGGNGSEEDDMLMGDHGSGGSAIDLVAQRPILSSDQGMLL
jgi:serralysin